MLQLPLPLRDIQPSSNKRPLYKALLLLKMETTISASHSRTNKFEWCVEFEGRLVGQTKLKVSEIDNRARYAVGLSIPISLTNTSTS